MLNQIQIRSLNYLKIIELIKCSDKQTAEETQVTALSSSRASIRRMQRETIAQPNILLATEQPSSSEERTLDYLPQRLESILSQIDLAMRDGRYSDALLHLQEIEELIDANKDKLINLSNSTIDPTIVHSLIEHLEMGLLSISRAYFLGLKGDSNAISLCDIGFDNLELVAKKFKALVQPTDSDTVKTKQMLEISHSLMRGMLEMCLNSRELAIEDLKTGFALAVASDLEFETELHFLIKTLEQKFQASLLPSPILIDEENPDTLILAGRYEEALELLSTCRFKDQAAYEGKRAVCLALMGKHDKALEIFNDQFYYMKDNLDRSFGICLVQILKKDYEKAREIIRDPATDPFFAAVLLLATQSQPPPLLSMLSSGILY